MTEAALAVDETPSPTAKHLQVFRNLRGGVLVDSEGVVAVDTSGNPLATDAYGRALTTGTRGTYGGQAGISGTVDVPPGAVVRSYAAQSGSSAASITVPGVTGTITVPGDSNSQTQFADNPDPGTMVGPCTFTFSSTAAYCVIWVL